MIFTRGLLDAEVAQGCDHPGCNEHGPLFFRSNCHPNERVDISYDGSGVLHLSCHRCDKTVADIAVADMAIRARSN